jgi:hypothetical protein
MTEAKEKPRLGGAGLRKLTTQAAYNALRLLQVPFCWGGWVLEQRASKLQDQLANEGSDR